MRPKRCEGCPEWSRKDPCDPCWQDRLREMYRGKTGNDYIQTKESILPPHAGKAADWEYPGV